MPTLFRKHGKVFRFKEDLSSEEAVKRIDAFLAKGNMKRRQPSRLEAFVAGAAPVATLGLIAPATAALKTATNELGLSGQPSVIKDDSPLVEKFRRNLDEIEAKARGARETFPGSAALGEVTGFVSPGSLARKGFETVAHSVASRVPGKIGRHLVAPAAANIAVGQALSEKKFTDLQGRREEVKTQAGLGVASGLLGGSLGSAFQKIFGRSKNLRPQALEAGREAAQKAKVNVSLSPAEQTTSRATDFVESLLERSPISSSFFAKLGKRQKAALEEGAKLLETKAGIADDAALIDEVAIGEGVASTLSKARDAFSIRANQLYRRVDDLAEEILFHPKQSREAVLQVKQEINRGVRLGETKVGLFVRDFARKLGKDANVPTENFKSLRTKTVEIGDLIQEADGRGLKNEARLLRTIDQAMMRDLNELESTFAARGNKEAAEALKIANRFFEHGKRKFESEIVGRIDQLVKDSRGSVERVFSEVVRKGRVQKVREFKALIGDKAFEPVHQRFLQNIVRDPKSGDIDVLGDHLERRLFQLGGKTTIGEILGPQDTEALFALAKVAKFAKTAVKTEKTPAGFNLSSLSALSAPAAFAGTAFLGGADPLTSLLVGGTANIALAKIWYSPLGRKLLVDGFKSLDGKLNPQTATLLIASILRQLQQEEHPP